MFKRARIRLEQELDIVAFLKKIRRFEAFELYLERRLGFRIEKSKTEFRYIDEDTIIPNAQDFPNSPRVQPVDEASDLNLNSSNNNIYDLVEEDTKRTGRGANKDIAIDMDMLRKNSKSEDIKPSSTA